MIHGSDAPNRIGLLPGEKPARPPVTYADPWNWLNITIISTPPIIALLGFFYGVQLTWSTFIIGFLVYQFNGMGITCGYHRCFAHRSFKGTQYNLPSWLRSITGWSRVNPVEGMLLFQGAGAFQGSCLWWSRTHRIHHSYVDTDLEPHSFKTRGFFWSHIGWLIVKLKPELLGYVDISDLKNNRSVMFQHYNYVALALTSGVFLPVLAAGLWSGDWLGGLCYAAMFKIFCVHTSTFFVNSLAHWDGLSKLAGIANIVTGYQPYSLTDSTAQDNLLVSFLALGEGLHNFHHSFDSHYANGPLWYNLDTTKWLILVLEALKLVRDVVRVPNSVFERSRANVAVQLAQKQVNSAPAHLKPEAEELLKKAQRQLAELDKKYTPVSSTMNMDTVKQLCSAGRKLMVVGEYVLDIEKPIDSNDSTSPVFSRWHPGGGRILSDYCGRDATEAFSGAVHKHSEGASNLLLHLRVANYQK